MCSDPKIVRADVSSCSLGVGSDLGIFAINRRSQWEYM
ncbi:hypothetical protein GJW-30_1_00472 [Variibacter gotjawalensis]|uniref:Uncharacterized protein n=1 Tax=Variibacter gotjawalensis TaxID=1333996 RepID=A0A0S3PPW1_9BRAD|nr:hypothetical protein [Variibacter gotjawalensis]BAT57961.1 hypothetical protein GJW-30_1_00472 [Variibacter gotjawalensis]